MKKSIRSILAATVVLVFALLAIGSGSSDSKETTSYAWSAQNEENGEAQATPDVAPETTEATTVKKNYKLGETFTMADFEVTLGTNYSFVKIDNQFSERYGQDVVKLPVTIKNVGSETTSFPLTIDYFGSKGTEVDNPSYYFDDNLSTSSNLRPGASQSGYLYFMYDGNGVYGLDFEELFSWSDDTISVEFEVTK